MNSNNEVGMSRSESGRLGWEKSKNVRSLQYKERVELYFENPTLCACCLTPLSYEKRRCKFCGSSCAAKINNLGCVRNGDIRQKNVCLNCDKETTNSKYCTNDCQKDYEWKQEKERIELNGSCDKNNIRQAERYMKEVFGEVCSVCGTKEWMGKIVPLVLDHINGNSEDSSLTNLRLICGNCDMQTETYKGKNRGKGRFSRRKRYSEGKSY